MQKYQDSVQDRNGNAVVGASVLVKTLAGATATIYSDNGVTAASNPLTTDSKGHFEFYAANGRYTLEISGAGLTATHTVTDILLDDETTETAIAGNLVFSNAAARIVGDFYNATHANRVIATSDAANKKAEFGVAPTTTSPTTDGNARAGYNAYNQSAVDNAAYAAMTIDYDKMRFSSGANGTGTVLPMSWEIGGTEVAAMSTAGIQTIAGGGIYGTNPDSVTFTSTAASAGKTLLVGNSNQGESARYVMSCITSGASVRTGSMVIDGQDNGALVIYLGGTEWVRYDRTDNQVQIAKPIAVNGGQLVFPSTQIPSTDANTLDDYKEGTWTPVVLGASSSGSATYTEQIGRYTKIGKTVRFSLSAKYGSHTGSGQMLVTLPVTISSSGPGRTPFQAFVLGQASSVQVQAEGIPGLDYTDLVQSTTFGVFSGFAISTASTNTEVFVAGTYEASS